MNTFLCTLIFVVIYMNNSAKIILEETNNLITSRNFIDQYKTDKNKFVRSRKLPFHSIILLILNFLCKTLQVELDNFYTSVTNDFSESVTKQAFSKARKFISPDAFKALFELTVKTAFSQNNIRRYKGFRIFAIDGTMIQLPDSKDIRTIYREFADSHTPRARVSAISDVLSGIIVHADMKPYSVGERTMALENLKVYKGFFKSKDLVIFDRGYPSKELITFLHENKMKYLMRVQKGFNKEIDSTESNDFFVTIGLCKVRVIKLTLDNGEKEVLITNLSQNFFIQCEFKQLYSLRWGIETKYRTIKEKMDLENFSGKTLISVHQDFYAVLYMSNLVSVLAMESDVLITKEREKKKWKHKYKTNENCLIGYVKTMFFSFFYLADSDRRSELLGILVKKASKSKTPVVVNRHFPRRKSAKKNTSLVKKAV